jgi:hypothetical protein
MSDHECPRTTVSFGHVSGTTVPVAGGYVSGARVVHEAWLAPVDQQVTCTLLG